jgi:hypothetical protein
MADATNQLLRHEETGKGIGDSFSFIIVSFGLVTTSMSKKNITLVMYQFPNAVRCCRGHPQTMPSTKKKGENYDYPLPPLK